MKKILLIICLIAIAFGCKKEAPTPIYSKVIINSITLNSLNTSGYNGYVQMNINNVMFYRSNTGIIANGFNCLVNDGMDIDSTTKFEVLIFNVDKNKTVVSIPFKTSYFVGSSVIKISDANINFDLQLQ